MDFTEFLSGIRMFPWGNGCVAPYTTGSPQLTSPLLSMLTLPAYCAPVRSAEPNRLGDRFDLDLLPYICLHSFLFSPTCTRGGRLLELSCARPCSNRTTDLPVLPWRW